MNRLGCLLIVVMAVSTAAPAAAQDAIAAAKELYASAAYEEALTALRTARDTGTGDVPRQADEYMAFCLLALGRSAEAEVAAESAIRRNPLASIDAKDASPRIEALFTQVRKRILPSLIRDGYRMARDTMNQGDSAKSMQQLADVRLMLDAAKTAGVWDDALGDIAVLVDGFLELSRATTAQRAAAPPPAAPQVIPPVVAPSQPALAARMPPRVYSAADTDVTPPVPIRQDIPEVRLDSPDSYDKAIRSHRSDDRCAGPRPECDHARVDQHGDRRAVAESRATVALSTSEERQHSCSVCQGDRHRDRKLGHRPQRCRWVRSQSNSAILGASLVFTHASFNHLRSKHVEPGIRWRGSLRRTH